MRLSNLSVKLASTFASVRQSNETFPPLLLFCVSVVALRVPLRSVYPPALTTHQSHLPKGKGQLHAHPQREPQEGGDWRTCRQWPLWARSLGGRSQLRGRSLCRQHGAVGVAAWRPSGLIRSPEGRGQQGALGFLLQGLGCGSDLGAALWTGARPPALSLGCRSPRSPLAAASCVLGSSVEEEAHNAVMHERSKHEGKQSHRNGGVG